MQTAKHQRIEWIDVVKGIAIMLMIVGHTDCPKTPKHMIFSFHMPLFFILSGLTFSPAKDWKSLLRKTWRSFCGLILPIVVVIVLQTGYNLIVDGKFSLPTYWAHVRGMFLSGLYWASGVAADGVAVLGVFWFVFSLFWGKLIVNLFSLLFGEKSALYLSTVTAMWVIYLGKGIYMPQNMDVTLVAVLFISAGMTARRYMDWIRRYKVPLFVIGIALWAIGFDQSAYIQMAARHYPKGMLCILTALAGSFSVCCIGEALSNNLIVRKALSFVGRHTLIMLILHHLFWSYSHCWAASSVPLMQLKRVALNIALTSAIVLLLHGLRWLIRRLLPQKAPAPAPDAGHAE